MQADRSTSGARRGGGPLTATLALAATLAVLALAASPAPARDAYVANIGASTVSVIDTATRTKVGPDIGVGAGPAAIAIAPDGKEAYVANLLDQTVSVIDTATNTKVGPDIDLGSKLLNFPVGPGTIAITPDGERAYVARALGTVSVIDTATRTKVGPDIDLGRPPGFDTLGIAITPDGGSAYVPGGNPVSGAGRISVIDTATNTKVGPDIVGGLGWFGIAIAPDGENAYVRTFSGVSVIDTATNTKVGPDIGGLGPPPDTAGIAIAPDGGSVYVVNDLFPGGPSTVSVIDTATRTKVGADIAVGLSPWGIAITPDGQSAYVVNRGDSDVSVIDTATRTKVGPDIGVGAVPQAIAITPEQSPPSPALAARKKQKPNKLKLKIASGAGPFAAVITGFARVPAGLSKVGRAAASGPKTKRFQLRRKKVMLEANETKTVRLRFKHNCRAVKKINRLLRTSRKAKRAKVKVKVRASAPPTGVPPVYFGGVGRAKQTFKLKPLGGRRRGRPCRSRAERGAAPARLEVAPVQGRDRKVMGEGGGDQQAGSAFPSGAIR